MGSDSNLSLYETPPQSPLYTWTDTNYQTQYQQTTAKDSSIYTWNDKTHDYQHNTARGSLCRSSVNNNNNNAGKDRQLDPKEEEALTKSQDPPSSKSAAPEYNFRWYDLALGVLGVGLYVFDVYSDLRLAAQYYTSGDEGYFGVTLGLVIVSYLVNMYASCMIFLDVNFSNPEWILIIVPGHLLYLGPVLV
jgi:hypothetical protein